MRRLFCLVAILLMSSSPSLLAQQETGEEAPEQLLALVGGDLYTITKGTIRSGTLLVKEGKLWKIGKELEVPEGAEVIEAKGQRILPGFVAAVCTGVGIASSAGKSKKLADALDPYNFQLDFLLAAGITTFYHPPLAGTGGMKVREGGAVVKAAREDLEGMLLQEPVSVHLGYASASPREREEFKAKLRRAREYLQQVRELPEDGKPPKVKSETKILSRVLSGERKLWLAAQRADELLECLQLAEEFELPVLLQGAVEGWLVADRLAHASARVIFSPRSKARRDESSARPSGSTPRLAAILHEHGVPFALIPPQTGIHLWGTFGQDLQVLNLEAAFAVRGGLEREAALAAITIEPARLLGVASRIGSLEPGKDADIIIMDGDPLDYHTHVRMVLVNGRVVYRMKEARLFEPLPED